VFGPTTSPDALSWDGHLALLYRTDTERLAWLAEWVRHGLRRGEKIVYVEPADAGPDSVLVGLRGHGIDTAALRADGQLEVLGPEAYYPVGGPEAAVHRALAQRFPAVRIAGRASSAQGVVSAAGHRDIEWGTDRLCRTQPVSALCQYAYPTGHDVLCTALSTHPTGFRERSFAGSGTRSSLALRGRVDATNVDLLACLVDAAIERSVAARLDRLRLDLAGVDSLLAEACATLARASEPFRTDGGRLVLDGAGAGVEQTLRTSGIAELPGVEMVAAGQ
jgi:hypothetical protein